MLSQKTIEIVKSTASVLEAKGIDITTVFYKNLFTDHPELLHIFNHSNQKQGRQQTALANAVYAAAQNIDQLHTILPVVKQIGHKHRSLGVRAEHYPIVGEHLLRAIKEVLGEAATDDIIAAWADAYGSIADAFIGVEKELYEQARNQKAGFADFKSFIVSKKVKESDVITSFYLEPEDGGDVPEYEAGQYISVRLNIPGETYSHIRQYSLSSTHHPNFFRISVKREGKGTVSAYLHDHLKVGGVLEVSAPAGDFVLNPETTPLVLISGGVGITPMMSMLETAFRTQPSRPVSFIHVSRNEAVLPFKAEVESMIRGHHDAKCSFVYGTLTLSEEHVEDDGADYYVCGPVPFMKAVIERLKHLGVPVAKIHYEFFGPGLDLAGVEEVEKTHS
ncbi:NO-inducible flavohemoprotein [Rossellomorea marisflavi]|uniref:NO-inducible flavohemoprotein n=1 Tax=Rossellomorea marisflavi TaxID=189381 RepID=UPI003ADAB0DE